MLYNAEQIKFPYLEVLKVLENQVGQQLDIGENREIKQMYCPIDNIQHTSGLTKGKFFAIMAKTIHKKGLQG